MSLTFIDLFAGAGGFRKGFEKAGHTCLGHCEWDKYANTSYNAIFDIKEGEWYESDIRGATGNGIPRADIWTFGAPCQDFSIAGDRKGLEGDRSSLVREVFRCLGEVKEEHRPKYIVYENVKGMLSSNKGFDFLEILIEMESLGYDRIEYSLLNTKDFGLPQNRERVFTIGHLRGRGGSKVFPIRGNNQKIGIQQIGNTVSTGNWNNPQRGRVYSANGICPALNCMQGGGLEPKIMIIGTTKSDTAKGTNCRSWVHDPRGIIGAISATEYKQPKQIFIRENTKKGYVEAYEGDGIRLDHIGGTTGRGRVQTQRSNTLTTGNHAGVIDKGFKIRKLTPKECWRLQGWLDEDFEKARKALNETFYKGNDKSGSQLYKQAGNGVSIPPVYEIAKRLK